jgi:outer membrane protein TolC
VWSVDGSTERHFPMRPASKSILTKSFVPSQWVRVASLAIGAAVFAAISATAQDAPKLTLKHAIDLALVHAPATAQANADELRASAAIQEARNNYIPQVVVGSGLGETWGYPLSLEGSAPSLINFTAQSALFNPALRDSIRSARREYQAVLFGNKDRRTQVVQDTALSYLELAKWEGMIAYVRQQQEDAGKMEQVGEQRIEAGIDSAQSRNQAKLASARARLHVLQAEGAMQSLRLTLSQLTGLPADSIQTDRDSIPVFPAVAHEAEAPAKTADENLSVLVAEQHALAVGFRARAEHRTLWPSVDFATQYAALAKYNNWQQFFPTKAFERNNATIGVVIRFPFFNASQHSRAEGADAEASHAKADVQSAKNQVSQQVLKLESSVRQLEAAREVSDLEFQIAKSGFDEVEVRMGSGGATVHDEANARADMSEKFDQLQDADFELTRARVALLRVLGELDSWAGIAK